MTPKHKAIIEAVVSGQKMQNVAVNYRVSLSTVSKVMSGNGYVRKWVKGKS